MTPPWPLVGYLAGLCLGAWLGSFAGEPWTTVLGASFGIAGFVAAAHFTGRRS